MKSSRQTNLGVQSRLFKEIGFNNFEQEIGKGAKPILVLCMHWNGEPQEQVRIIEMISKKYAKDIKVGLLEEEFIAPFSEKFGVTGSPTYILFVGGRERGRMLGRADPKTLENFLMETIPSLGAADGNRKCDFKEPLKQGK
jgi:thioredoxin-like negative regulator of GroEL